MASLSFDSSCMGSEIVLSRRRRTAKRRHARSEFSNAVAVSSEPLLDGELFEISLDEHHAGWGNSLAIGVTGLQPYEDLDAVLPPCATDLGTKTVLIRGSSVFVNGKVSREDYCESLDNLQQGSRVGVAVVNGDLHLYVDGTDLGSAHADLSDWCPLRAVVDLHGSCVQVSLTDSTSVVPTYSEWPHLLILALYHTHTHSGVKLTWLLGILQEMQIKL